MAALVPRPNEDLRDALRQIFTRPVRTLMPMWSWKSACISAFFRAATFFVTNLRAGRLDAVRAGVVEALFAIFAAGVMGATSQRLRLVQPAWATALVVWLAMPAAMLLAQFGVQHLVGTPHMGTGLIVSFCIAAIASSFSWYAMRHGVLLGGAEETSVRSDVRRMPRIVSDYLLAIPRALFGKLEASKK